MKKITALLAALSLAGVGVVGIASAASAHDGGVSASCTGGLTVDLTNYPKGSTLAGTIDDHAYPAVTFNGSYFDRITWEPTVDHAYRLAVTSGDGDHRYDKVFAAAVTGCVPVTPPATETPTPKPTPSTPPVTETPTPKPTPSTPVVTPKPTPPVATPTPTPTTPVATPTPSTPTVTPPKPTPTRTAVAVPPVNTTTPPPAAKTAAASQGELAFTGTDRTQGIVLSVSAVVLLTAGILLFIRQRRARRA